MKRLLKGGRVVDPVNGIDGVHDVLIDGDRVSAVGRDLPVDGAAVVDVPRGFIVCPGFIDMHVHLSRARAGAQGNRGKRHSVGGGGAASQRSPACPIRHPSMTVRTSRRSSLQERRKRVWRGCIPSEPSRAAPKANYLRTSRS